MRVLRSNKDSVMAMLEAFVHDPLINWRLLNTTTDAVDAGNTPTGESSKLPGYSPGGSVCLDVQAHLPCHAVRQNRADFELLRVLTAALAHRPCSI